MNWDKDHLFDTLAALDRANKMLDQLDEGSSFAEVKKARDLLRKARYKIEELETDLYLEMNARRTTELDS